MAIAAFVLGVVALLLCWVPFINNVAAVLAVVGLGLGIPALVSARRGKRSGAGLAVAGVVLSVVAFVGVVATQAWYGSVIDDVVDDIDSSAPASSSDDPGDGEPPAAGETEASASAGARVLPVGQAGQVGEYTVTVDSVTINANEIVARENRSNDPPSGQYVLVGVTVTYHGTDEGDPWIDLSTEFIGADARKYDTGTCSAVTPDEVMNVPTLLTGGTASYQECMDVPPTAIDGGRVEVSESFSFDDDSQVWGIR